MSKKLPAPQDMTPCEEVPMLVLLKLNTAVAGIPMIHIYPLDPVGRDSLVQLCRSMEWGVSRSLTLCLSPAGSGAATGNTSSCSACS